MDSQYTYMVCTRCMTFNHHAYIEDAMNGFCMQQTNFPFVCVIVDDASTDGEQEVIKKYFDTHFDLSEKEETDDYVMAFGQHKTNNNCYFAVLYLKYNHYSLNKKSKNPYYARWYDNSKYIAICEGDDYLIVTDKLQRQVDFLEENEEYSMVFHGAEIKAERGASNERFFIELEDREYSSNEIIQKWIIPTASMLHRATVISKIPKNKYFVFGDDVIYATCLSMGKVFGMSAKMSVYRLVPTGWMATHSGKQRLYSSISQRKGLMEEFPFYRCNTNYQYMTNTYYNLMCKLLKEKNIKEFRNIKSDYYNTIPNHSMCRFALFCIKDITRQIYTKTKSLFRL